MTTTRMESDSLGELAVPADAIYGAQTQRALNNFEISGLVFQREFIDAIALIKCCAAFVNTQHHLDVTIADAIRVAAQEIINGDHGDQFPLDVFQTGSGTSTNMNVNEVIAHRASEISGRPVHPNDHVNMSQSSNDVIPSAIHIAACARIENHLKPALLQLMQTIREVEVSQGNLVKTGRTHLMDAVPLTLGQELSAWHAQIGLGLERIEDGLKRLTSLPLGGTAIGTGINAPPGFSTAVISELATASGIKFSEKANKFEGIAAQDAAVEMSGHLNTLAVSLMKISNDLRWMNSGPLAGLSEISLMALQPGSSIMPGKVNPVIPEAVAMVCAQVMGNHVTVTIAGQSGNFQLNTMLPIIAYNLLQSIELLANGAQRLADKAISTMTVNEATLNKVLSRNPVLATALNAHIGYEKAAVIAKRAYAENRSVLDIAREETDIDEASLREILDPSRQTGFSAD